MAETDPVKIAAILANPSENNAAKIARIYDRCPSCGNHFFINDEGKIEGDLMPLHGDRNYPGADALCQKCGVGLRLMPGGRIAEVKRIG
jgi:hypothetical protein